MIKLAESIMAEPGKETGSSHIPVMLQEVLEYLQPKSGHTIVDATLGLGGHTNALAPLIGDSGKIISIDKDKQSIEMAKSYLQGILDRCEFVHEDFRNIDKVLDRFGIKTVDAIVADLGISSFQLDNPNRGFSFRSKGPLDMRMDQDNENSAFELINSHSEKELAMILKEYGDERWHHRIAKFLIAERKKGPIQTTDQLSQIILRAMPYKARRQKIHPATRSFQAFRIAVNRELENLEIFLNKCVEILKPGGRLGIISFHSLEDRLVKQKFRQWDKDGTFKVITKKPLRPSQQEEELNPRSRSARLRIAERL